MKPALRNLASLAGVIACLPLASCIDVAQDLWIAADGSGRVKVDMGVSKKMLEMAGGFGGEAGGEAGAGASPFDMAKQKKKLEANPNVGSVKITTADDEVYRRFIYDVEIKDVTKLDAVMDDIFEDGPAGGGREPDGEFAIVKLDNGNYKITAKLEASLPAGAQPEAAALEVMRQMFGDAAFTFRIHGSPVTHDGTPAGDAAVWKISIADLVSGKALRINAEVKPK